MLKIIEKIVEPIIGTFNDNVSHYVNNRLLEYKVTEEKIKSYTKTVLHRSHPVKLIDIYQPLTIENRTLGKRYGTTNISEIFDDNRFITVIGDAGAGKSTFLKYVFLQILKAEKMYPVFLNFRHLNSFKGTLAEYIEENIFKFSKIAESKSIFDKLLESGDFCFIIDGYDELNQKKVEIVNVELGMFIERYYDNCFLISSRPHSNAETLKHFSNYNICDFNKKEIESFVVKQAFNMPNDLRDKIISSVKNLEKDNAYSSYLKNPLLLSMYILSYEKYPELPKQKYIFYRNVFEALYTQHDTISKEGFIREKISGLSRYEFEDIIYKISAISFFDEKYIFSRDYLSGLIEKILGNHSKTEKVLVDLIRAIAIIRVDGQICTFPHKSLQEYFCIKYMINTEEKKKKILYQKVNDKLVNVNNKNIEMNHFMSLILELDPIKAREYLILPLIESLINIGNSSSTIEIRIAKFFRLNDVLHLLKYHYSAYYDLISIVNSVEELTNNLKELDNSKTMIKSRIEPLKSELSVKKERIKRKNRSITKRVKQIKSNAFFNVNEEGKFNRVVDLEYDRLKKLKYSVKGDISTEIEKLDDQLLILESKVFDKKAKLNGVLDKFFEESKYFLESYKEIIKDEINKLRKRDNDVIDLII